MNRKKIDLTEINHLQLQFDSNKETAQIKIIIISTEEMLKDLPFEEKVS